MILYCAGSIQCVILITLTLNLCACGSSEDDLSRYISSIKSKPSRPIEPIPEFKPLPKFSYPEQDNRRSPFRPIQIANQLDVFALNTNRQKQPLEAFPLDALKFVGILKQGGNIWGLILQPGGLVTRVKVGDYMGKNYGQVIHVQDKVIILEETISSSEHWEKKKVTFDLYSLEKGSASPSRYAPIRLRI